MTIFKPILIPAVIAGLCGALAGYYTAVHVPIQAQIAIIDIDKLIKDNESSGTDAATQKRVSLALSKAIKAKAQELASYGLIVLDGKSVISAPEEAYADVNR